MIKFGNIQLDTLGLRIKKVKGIHDFPKLKSDGFDWTDEHYVEASGRIIDTQYDSRKITIDCFVVADNWTSLDSKLSAIAAGLILPGLKMLILSNYTYRGFMCYLAKSTMYKPARYYINNKSVAEFSLTFEEPQPFNVQFSFYSETSLTTSIMVVFKKLIKSMSMGSLEQRYITLCYDNVVEEYNIEQEDAFLSQTIELTPGIPYPVIALGEIDEITAMLATTSNTASMILGVDTCEYYARNAQFS